MERIGLSRLDEKASFRRLLGVMYLPHGMTGQFEPGKLSSQIGEDLDKIWRMGFNTVYLFDITRHPELGTTYSQLWYPEHAPRTMGPLSFDQRLQGEIEAGFASVFRQAKHKGLNVMLAICYSIPPQWLWSNLDAAKRKSDGSLHYTVYYHECFRSEKIRWYTRGRLKQLFERYAHDDEFQDALARFRINGDDACLDEGGRPLFVIHNDTVDRGFCYCETCRKAWTGEFLPRIYKDIRRFNATHKTRYESFAEVPLPADCRNERLWFELSQFFTEGLMGWMETVRSVVREHVPDALLSIVMKYPRSSWATQYPDWVRVSDLCDVLFMDPYPMESGSKWNIRGYAFDFETYRSISLITGKPIMSQYQLASSYSDFDMKAVRAPTVREILQQFYVAIGRGTRGMVCWGLPPGIADDAHPETRLDEKEAIEVAARINREAEQLFLASEDTKEVYGQIMLPYSYPSVIRGDDSLQELFRLYSYFSGMGLSANPTFADFMPLMADRTHMYRAIVGFSSLRNVGKNYAKSLAAWIKEGGMLLCGSDSFTRDENGNAESLEPFNQQVVGSRDTDQAAEGDLQLIQERPYLPKTGLYARPKSATALKATVGEVVGRWSRSKADALTVNRFGRGLALRAGLAGGPRLEDPAVAAILQAFAESILRSPIRVTSPDASDVVFCLRKGRDLIVYLVNNEDHPSRMRVEIWPEPLGIKSTDNPVLSDALTQERIPSGHITRRDGALCFEHTLPPLASRTIRICVERDRREADQAW